MVVEGPSLGPSGMGKEGENRTERVKRRIGSESGSQQSLTSVDDLTEDIFSGEGRHSIQSP
jgi:hypothetical protein